MVSCVACGCSRTKNSKEKDVTFHRFPRDLERRLQWAKLVHIEDWKPTKSSLLCSQHFTNDCFDRTSLCMVRLKEDAVPTREIKRLKYARTLGEAVTIDLEEDPLAIPEPTAETSIGQTATYASPVECSSCTSLRAQLNDIKSKKKDTRATSPDTSREILLKRKIQELGEKDKIKSKKIRTLQKQVWHQKVRLSWLSGVIDELKAEIDIRK